MQPDYWKKAQRELSRNCPTMKKLIAGYKGERGLSARGDGFYTLLRAIAGQQISVKAADAVWRKLEKSVVPLTPQSLLRKRDASLRKCGFSAQKVLYAKNVAKFFAGNHVDAGYWAARTDEEIIKELTSIKGIGTWTAEMFLIFHLLRPDVLPLKDLGLVKAIDPPL
ncbi:MAG: DNA-3-methyladenine glycosylase 2 family protein [Alphaproteobacteria bacterium]